MNDITTKPKRERIAAARAEFATIDEYTRGPAISTLSSRYNISAGEAAAIVDEPMHLITQARRDADREFVQGKGCHYCGQPAVKTNFFDVPVCGTC